MARFDHSHVFVTNMTMLRPTFHHVPAWHGGEGCVGPYHESNIILGQGVLLPDEVRAPCGETYMKFLVKGTDPDHRPDSDTTPLPGIVRKQARMHFTHGFIGAELPRGHAEKFARPCRRCFPA